MSNDEIFFLCVLTGAKEILGIVSPIGGFSEEAARAKWQEVSKDLYEKEILYNNDKGEICIKDEYEKISAAISFPDIAFDCPIMEGVSNYIYIKGSIYVLLRREEDCEVKLYENREEFITFLNKEFMLSSCDNEITIEISEEKMNKAVEFSTAGKMQQAIKIFNVMGFSTDDVRSALNVLTGFVASKDFTGYRQNQETPSQALFKTVKTQKGTWLYKILNGFVKIRRCNPDEALSEVLNF